MNQKRGMITARIKEKSIELLGYEIDQDELRLMPYILFTMLNTQRIDYNKINVEEREILRKWRELGYIGGGISGLGITKEFWDICNEIVFLGYVDLGEE